MIRRLTANKDWFVEWYQEWSQLWEDCNWYDATFFELSFENDKIMGGVELTFILFGLGFRWRWNHTVTPDMKHCLDAVAEIEAGTAKTRPLAEFVEENCPKELRPRNPVLDEIPEAYIHRDGD